ncbi:MAG: glycine--tRNA ligase subunit beta [Caldimicrobium sp.]
MTKNLLFEIGTEELPARFIKPALESLKNFTELKLNQLEIPYEEIKVAGTCRRLVLFVKNLAERQKEREEEILGPAFNVGMDQEGKYTPALLGFAKKHGLKPEELSLKDTPKGKYFYAKKIIFGKETIKLLPELLLEILQNIYFPKKMRWGNYDVFFGRPIRWLLALYGKESIDIEIAGIKSSLHTKGHSFLAKKKLPITEADWEVYKNTLQKNYVIVEVEERKKFTLKSIEEVSKKYGKVVIDEALLEENAHLVEYPFPVVGKFPEKFLTLPPKLVITALQEHQRYFYLVDEKEQLLPYFIAVNNNKPKDELVVIKGHERVAKARLEDAMFYYERDLKEKLIQKVEKLKGIVYHVKAGNLYEKTLRLIELLKYLRGELYPEIEEKLVEKVGLYAKADLTTEVVKEFPTLQGYMGSHYLQLEGEKEVAKALYEQYLPTPKDEGLPHTKLGILLSLADKIDHLATLVGVGEKVTGEGDPFALRRAAYGIVKILIGCKIFLHLEQVFSYALDLVKNQGYLKNTSALHELIEFVKKRLEGELLSYGFSKNFIYVIMDQTLNPYQQYLKLKALKEIYQQKDFQDLIILFKRVTQILKNHPLEVLQKINPELFEEEIEKKLYEAILAKEELFLNYDKEMNYNTYLEDLLYFKPIIDEFFDKVFVMVEAEALRLNRLSLLNRLSKFFYRFGDLSYLA